VKNDTGEIIIYMIHEQNLEHPVVRESSCCSYYGDGVHWQTRDMPVKVFQSSSIYSFMANLETAWKLQTEIDLIGPIMQSQQDYSEAQISVAQATGINTIGYNQIVGDFAGALAITRLTLSENQQHYTHYAIIMNSAYTNICDAVHTPSCYDEKSIINHEVGHCYGLLDEYSSECSLYLMYGSLSVGSIRKRSIDTLTSQCVITLYQGLPSGGEITDPSNSAQQKHITQWIHYLGLVLLVAL
jgi:hypothetical protein